MITRRHKVNLENAEISFSFSFTIADVFQWLHGYLEIDMKGLNKKEREERMNDYVQPCNWITDYILRNPECVGWMTTKHAMVVSEWAIVQAVKSGLLSEAGKNEADVTLYKFTPNLLLPMMPSSMTSENNKP